MLGYSLSSSCMDAVEGGRRLLHMRVWFAAFFSTALACMYIWRKKKKERRRMEGEEGGVSLSLLIG